MIGSVQIFKPGGPEGDPPCGLNPRPFLIRPRRRLLEEQIGVGDRQTGYPERRR